MKVFVRPTGLYSRAMVRVAWALAEHAPTGVQIVERRADADLVVSHVIGPDQPPDQNEIVIQYCLASAGLDHERWLARWRKAWLVWSYYDLQQIVGASDFPFYFAPLGVDEVFTKSFKETKRDIGVMTSGYVSADCGEAIEEVSLAAWMLGLPQVHLGPAKVEGMRTEIALTSILGVSDDELAAYYQRCKWVSGLRHVEGFELPIVEGMCCGARPIAFDRPDMHQWYDGHAVFIPECSGVQLVRYLLDVLDTEPEPVLQDEREWAIRRFAWKPIAEGFWRCVSRSHSVRSASSQQEVAW